MKIIIDGANAFELTEVFKSVADTNYHKIKYIAGLNCSEFY
jgi:hypothetical protein